MDDGYWMIDDGSLKIQEKLHFCESVLFTVGTYKWFNVISEDWKELYEGQGGIVKLGWLRRC
jgi:hypothetical protein